MQKKSLSKFCSELQRSLEDFEIDMEKAKFTAHRNDAQWFKMFQDYLGISDLDKNEINENDFDENEEDA